MILADIIMLCLIAVVVLLGIVVGFSGGLKFFTGGIFGVIISVIVTYFLWGIVYSWDFVQDLFAKLNEAMSGLPEGAAVAIDNVILAVLLFVLVQIVRIIIVKLIAGFFEIDNAFFKVINKIFGIALMGAVVFVIGLIVFQIIYWVGGQTAQDVVSALKDSVFKLDVLYENNPLRDLVDMITGVTPQ